MNILVVGAGSIGKRHITNLQTLGYNKISIVNRSVVTDKNLQHFKKYQTIEDACSSSTYDVAFICTPTAYHAKHILILLAFNIPKLYVEKPVSHNYDAIADIIKLAAEKQCSIWVGYDLRYDPGIQKVQNLIHKNIIGDIITIQAVAGQYLPDWRPHEDYRNGMSAKIEKGGGVLLDLAHEFDYVNWLAGEAEKIACFYQHSGALQIETEDVAEVIIRFKNGITGTIHVDYWQQKLVRYCRITGSKGTIQWNLADCFVKWINNTKEEAVYTYPSFSRNDRFLAIVKDFMEDTITDKTVTLGQGLESLQMILAAKLASENDLVIDMNNFSV